jgi:SAM-dependent methyltransferase
VAAGLEIPLPPAEYINLVSGDPDARLFLDVGQGLLGILRDHTVLAGARFLDVGCGCGRLARLLPPQGLATYEGFDRHDGMVAWCQQHIAAVAPRFRFTHVSVRSVYTGWDGRIGEQEASRFTFPYPDGAFDVALLASVFTHMDFADTTGYLHQLGRVCAPGARIIASVFLEGDPALAHPINFGATAARYEQAFAEAGLAVVARFQWHQTWYVLSRLAAPPHAVP